MTSRDETPAAQGQVEEVDEVEEVIKAVPEGNRIS